MRAQSPVGLVIIAIAAILISACSSAPPVQPIKKSPEVELNQADAVNTIENEITAAAENQIDVLSPAMFDRAENAFLKAKAAAEKDSDIQVILEHANTARTYLHTAEENAKVARTVLETAIENRNKARAAGATDLESKYQEIEDWFLTLTKAIEKGNIRYAQKNASEVADEFKKIELRAIKKENIGEVKKLLKQAEEDDITQYAPKSFALANKLLNETDTFISKNPYAKDEIYKMARHALFMAKRALAIADQSKAIESMPPEEIAFYIEDTLSLITRKLGAPDMRDQKFYIQVDNIEKLIQSLLDSNQMMTEKLKSEQTESEAMQADYEKRINELNQQIAFLQGKTEEEQAANEQLLEQQRRIKKRLEAERQFNLLFTEVQNYFEADEADVYKKGNQLVIRLKGIGFPVGQAVIMPDTYSLLSKVQRAIRTFDDPSVIIEGHTDSTGTHEFNKNLSRQRAESVRKYLIANQTLPAEKLTAAGFGSERPLASNATPEGRAMNRRIDIIITPQTQPGEAED